MSASKIQLPNSDIIIHDCTSNTNIKIVFIDDKSCNNDDVELGIAVFTTTESNEGESHVIEHCIASTLSLIRGVTCTANVQHHMTYYNLHLQVINEELIEKIFERIFVAQFLKKEGIYYRESCHVGASEDGKKKIEGVVFDEILMKSREPMYTLLNKIPQTLFRESQYAYCAGGTILGLMELTYEKCKSYYERHYFMENSCICIKGNKEIFHALTYINKVASRYIKGRRGVHKPSSFFSKIQNSYINFNVKNKAQGLYSISWEVRAPLNQSEYNTYWNIKRMLQNWLQEEIGSSIRVIYRNLIGKAFIAVIFEAEVKEVEKLKYKILQIVKQVSEERVGKLNYVLESIYDRNNLVSNEKVLIYVSEAYFMGLPILSYLDNRDIINQLPIKKYFNYQQYMITSVETESISNYETYMTKYIKENKPIILEENQSEIDWRSNQINKEKYIYKDTMDTAYRVKRYKEAVVYNYINVGKYNCTRIYYDITNLELDQIYVLNIFSNYLNRIKVSVDLGFNVQSSIFPLYSCVSKQSKTYFILKVTYYPGKMAHAMEYLNKIMENLIGKEQIEQLLDELKKEFVGKRDKNLLCLVPIHLLSYYRLSDLHKNLIIGFQQYVYIKEKQELLKCIIGKKWLDVFKSLHCNHISMSSYEQEGDISDEYKDYFINLLKINKENIASVRKRPAQKEIIITNTQIPFLNICVDIGSLDAGDLLKYKVISEVIKKLCVIPKLREAGIYNGELDIIEGVMIMVIQNPPSNDIVTKLIDEIQLFIDQNANNLITSFEEFLRGYMTKKDRKKSSILNDYATLTLLLPGSIKWEQYILKQESVELKLDDLNKYKAIIEGFRNTNGWCLICNEAYANNNFNTNYVIRRF